MVISDRDRIYLRGVGERVRLIRGARRLTQDELARKAGISRVSLGSIERGEQAAGLLTFVAIAEALGLGLGPLVDLNAQIDVLQLLGNPLHPTN